MSLLGGKPSWYDYKYCSYCGKELIRIEEDSATSFNPRTGRANIRVEIHCPDYSYKTSNGKNHLRQWDKFDPTYYDESNE